MPNQDKAPSTGPRRQVGYFCHLKVDEKHLGGILVTNQIGVPLEFRYTEPIVATKMHKILYGSVLEKYIHETVIRDRLAREVRTEPDYYIAPYEEREFLTSASGKEMVALQNFNTVTGEVSGPFTRIRDREAIVLMEEGQALRVFFPTDDEARQHAIATWLQEIGRTMDILEPLERVETALRSVCGGNRQA